MLKIVMVICIFYIIKEAIKKDGKNSVDKIKKIKRRLILKGKDRKEEVEQKQFINIYKKGSKKDILMALNKGADFNAPILKDGITPLFIAGSYNQEPEVIKKMIYHGADYTLKEEEYGQTPLMMAAQMNKNPEIIQTFIDKGADIHATDNAGWTPLIWAVGDNINPKISLKLIEAGADVNYTTPDGLTPLMRAAHLNSNRAIIRLLLNYGADIKIRAKGEMTPLMSAAANNSNPQIIVTLIKGGADVNTKSKKGFTPLFYAVAKNKNYEVVKALLEEGADPNIKAQDGKTPLMAAAKYNSRPEKIILLLKNGADYMLKDNHGLRAIDYLQKNRNLRGSLICDRLKELTVDNRDGEDKKSEKVLPPSEKLYKKGINLLLSGARGQAATSFKDGMVKKDPEVFGIACTALYYYLLGYQREENGKALEYNQAMVSFFEVMQSLEDDIFLLFHLGDTAARLGWASEEMTGIAPFYHALYCELALVCYRYIKEYFPRFVTKIDQVYEMSIDKKLEIVEECQDLRRKDFLSEIELEELDEFIAGKLRENGRISDLLDQNSCNNDEVHRLLMDSGEQVRLIFVCYLVSKARLIGNLVEKS